MKTRLPRRVGSVFAFLALAGCAVPQGANTQVSGVSATTMDAQTTLAPQSYGSGLNNLPDTAEQKGKLADAEPLTDGPNIGDFQQLGRASWYGRGFHGRKTANGERFDMHALTAAHRTLPLGSYVRVTNPATNDTVVVRINDRGPYARGRVIDLSYAAAKILHLAYIGTARVKIEGLTQREAKVEMSQILASNQND
ncbi:septal ring lytic transglycosylase RlpA family protein [Paraburkholderia sp. LEh10]|uniref:septal ring lytic transglycosylase RlpA family protein n=1 Tax=Paraburkholderia sp. LEh10 TaxID=2821353 RepID=UPI001AE5EE99|nr:septal ring lytic transglycosylase RlpA family protein [Paraburkholderia sp. LEh10]MBP0594557.1 septal ring lytic transglycosylase RlpA family protein [Paraburkholderia sp. LEh10]